MRSASGLFNVLRLPFSKWLPSFKGKPSSLKQPHRVCSRAADRLCDVTERLEDMTEHESPSDHKAGVQLIKKVHDPGRVARGTTQTPDHLVNDLIGLPLAACGETVPLLPSSVTAWALRFSSFVFSVRERLWFVPPRSNPQKVCRPDVFVIWRGEGVNVSFISGGASLVLLFLCCETSKGRGVSCEWFCFWFPSTKGEAVPGKEKRGPAVGPGKRDCGIWQLPVMSPHAFLGYEFSPAVASEALLLLLLLLLLLFSAALWYSEAAAF